MFQYVNIFAFFEKKFLLWETCDSLDYSDHVLLSSTPSWAASCHQTPSNLYYAIQAASLDLASFPGLEK